MVNTRRQMVDVPRMMRFFMALFIVCMRWMRRKYSSVNALLRDLLFAFWFAGGI